MAPPSTWKTWDYRPLVFRKINTLISHLVFGFLPSIQHSYCTFACSFELFFTDTAPINVGEQSTCLCQQAVYSASCSRTLTRLPRWAVYSAWYLWTAPFSLIELLRTLPHFYRQAVYSAGCLHVQELFPISDEELSHVQWLCPTFASSLYIRPLIHRFSHVSVSGLLFGPIFINSSRSALFYSTMP